MFIFSDLPVLLVVICAMSHGMSALVPIAGVVDVDRRHMFQVVLNLLEYFLQVLSLVIVLHVTSRHMHLVLWGVVTQILE